MAYDGFTTAAMAWELEKELGGGRINKIAQPEADALLITARGNGGNHRLLLSANASLPLLYLTEKNRPSPLTAPNFCMLLRKHIGSAHILKIEQPGMERVVVLHLEHLNDMGDTCHKDLIIELMGKHSNLIFCDDKGMILDSIKHVSANVSSVREVLPGRDYFIPQTTKKEDPKELTEEAFASLIRSKALPLDKAIVGCLTGFSPVMANELCHRAGIDPDRYAPELNDAEALHLGHTLVGLMEMVKNGEFTPSIVYLDDEPVEFGVLPFTQYGREYRQETYPSVSAMLEAFYTARDEVGRIRQRSADLRRILTTHLDKDRKKLLLQEKQLADTEKMDKYRIYGELLNTYGYGIPEGSKSAVLNNYYTGEDISVPLDPQLTPTENAKKYFARYQKLKRTQEALSVQVEETRTEIEHLESIAASLDIARTEGDLKEIRREMEESSYVKKKNDGGKSKKTDKMTPKSKPFHYLSSDGYDIYVGRNNYQNDELTFKFATGGDWWFHAKKIPGSHVIVKTQEGPVPDRVFEEAGALAAHYSAASGSDKVEIDYVERKHVKKPSGAKPGFVVYYTNYSLVASPDISKLKEVN